MELKEHTMGKEVDREVFAMYLDCLKKTADLITVITPIIWKFDGKVYNARLENTINKELKDRNNTASIDIANFNERNIEVNSNFYAMDDRCYRYTRVRNWNNEVIKDTYCSYIPQGYNEVKMAYAWCNVSYSMTYEDRQKLKIKSDDRWYYYDDNYNIRINSSYIVKLMEDRQKEIIEEIKRLTVELTKIDEYETRLKNIKAELEQLHSEIPYQFRDFFGLKSFVAQWN